MLKKSFLGLFVGLILSIAMSNVSAKIVQRIVGGNFAPLGRFKHQVSLQMIGQDCTIHQCGGSIIDDLHIITAAHCVINDYDEFQNYNITIMAGTTDLRNKSSGIYRDVEYTIVPTSYKSKGTDDDIAILRLKHHLPLKSESHRIRAINLPADDYRYKPPNTKIAIVSGFGSYKQKWNSQSGKIESGPLSPRLKFATGLINKIEPQFGCRDTEVCVRNNNSHGACHGDSGGPLIDPSTNTLIGIVSYSNHKWCGKTTKYTRVSSYLDFINKVRAGGLMDRNFISILHQNFDNEKIVGQLPYCT